MLRRSCLILALAFGGCSAQDSENGAQLKTPAPHVAGAGAGSQRGQPLPPRGVGKVLENKGGTLSPTPVVTVDPSVTGLERSTLQEILDGSLAVLASTAFLEHAKLVDADYPSVYLVSGTTEAASAAARRLQTAHSVGGYLPTRIKIDRGSSGAYVQANAGSDGLTMFITQDPITNWRSANSVQKSCAINTVAHEITHTLTRENQKWDPWFVDTDTSDVALQASRRNGTTGSYVMGGLAQCSYLNSRGRVGNQFMRSCVPTWYFYVPPANGLQESSGFANLSCDKYAENDVVQIRE